MSEVLATCHTVIDIFDQFLKLIGEFFFIFSIPGLGTIQNCLKRLKKMYKDTSKI